MQVEINRYPDYQPLKWPPEIRLAQLHLKCSCPGKDNIQGDQCPCCGRYQKLKVSNWPSRDIVKDFKAYGGGVTSYFSLAFYMIISFVILTITLAAFHIYCVQIVCPLQQQLKKYECITFLYILKFSTVENIYNTLYDQVSVTLATIFLVLETLTFVLLILFTIGMKIMLKKIKDNYIIAEKKAYSKFALILKNIPSFYQIDDVKKQLKALDQSIEINQIFFLHQTAQFQKKYKTLFDMYYQILFFSQKVEKGQDLTQNKGKLKNIYQDYQKLYNQVDQLKKKLTMNNGRAIVVLNTTGSRNLIKQKLHISQVSKFSYYSMKLFGFNTQQLNFYADSIEEPHQIHWNYIGQSSIHKTKIRIQTTVIGIGWMLICFAILYFPIIKIDEEKIYDPLVGNILNIVISLLVQILAFSYRAILQKLIPKRKPSSKLSQSYFIVFSTVFFHFFFFLVAPGTFYLVAIQIPKSVKLAQLFTAIVLFLLMGLLIAAIDLKYRGFNKKKKNLLFNPDIYRQYCQLRLHQQLNHPNFPLEFRLMVMYNIWSFNAFYVFQIPYLMVLFLIVLFIIYWIDKKNLYKHYKMQTFQSIDLQINFHNSYIILFLMGICLGYAISAWQIWQYILAGGAFILSFILNLLLNWIYKKQDEKQKQKQKSMTIGDMLQSFKKQEVNQNMITSFKQNQLKASFLVNVDNISSQSLGSMVFSGSYQQIYEKYLNQFKNRTINDMLFKKYQFIKAYLQQMNSDLDSIAESNHKKKSASHRQRGSQLVKVQYQSLPNSLPLNQQKLQVLSLNDKREPMEYMKEEAKSNSVYSADIQQNKPGDNVYNLKNENLVLQSEVNNKQKQLKQQNSSNSDQNEKLKQKNNQNGN